VQHSFKGCFIASKSIEEAVEDKALERGSKLIRVSSYRNSRVCPVHFVRLGETNDWHTLQCPLGHYVDRDYASVMNMTWKATPEAWTKGVWWDLKREKMDWKIYEGDSNPIIPHPIVQYIHTTLKEFKASEQSPAMPARGKPMNPTGYKMKVAARKPPQDGEEAGIILSGDTTNLETHTQATPQTHTHGDLPKP